MEQRRFLAAKGLPGARMRRGVHHKRGCAVAGQTVGKHLGARQRFGPQTLDRIAPQLRARPDDHARGFASRTRERFSSRAEHEAAASGRGRTSRSRGDAVRAALRADRDRDRRDDRAAVRSAGARRAAIGARPHRYGQDPIVHLVGRRRFERSDRRSRADQRVDGAGVRGKPGGAAAADLDRDGVHDRRRAQRARCLHGRHQLLAGAGPGRARLRSDRGHLLFPADDRLLPDLHHCPWAVGDQG